MRGVLRAPRDGCEGWRGSTASVDGRDAPPDDFRRSTARTAGPCRANAPDRHVQRRRDVLIAHRWVHHEQRQQLATRLGKRAERVPECTVAFLAQHPGVERADILIDVVELRLVIDERQALRPLLHAQAFAPGRRRQPRADPLWLADGVQVLDQGQPDRLRHIRRLGWRSTHASSDRPHHRPESRDESIPGTLVTLCRPPNQSRHIIVTRTLNRGHGRTRHLRHSDTCRRKRILGRSADNCIINSKILRTSFNTREGDEQCLDLPVLPRTHNSTMTSYPILARAHGRRSTGCVG